MYKIIFRSVIALIITVLSSNVLMAQLLDNDTLYIGEATGAPGEQVIVPVHIRTSVDYAGWQIPITFGSGQSPVYCDSVNLEGSIMTDTLFRPGGWDFIAPFTNNNEWDNVQTCGVAGIIWLSPPIQDLPPGFYSVMNLYFTIDNNASAQTIALDTLGASWYNGGPINHYLIVIPPGYSRITHVVQGAIHIQGTGVSEGDAETILADLDVYPTVIRSGSVIKIAYANSEKSVTRISLFDAAGRRLDTIYNGVRELDRFTMNYTIKDLPNGVYFVVVEENNNSFRSKVIVQ